MAKVSIWNPKSNHIFEAARMKVSALADAFQSQSKTSLEKNRFFKVIENDPKSPMIMGMGDKMHLIYYPENSTPYLHKYESSIKDVEVLDGEIFDELSGKKYVKGDKFQVFAGTEVKPYTLDKECYIKVRVTGGEDIWERVCN